MALADDGDEFLGADLVKFPVVLAGDGDGQGRNVEAGSFCLGGGIHGGGIGNDTDHNDLPFDKFFDN